jgi:hypothetical protein
MTSIAFSPGIRVSDNEHKELTIFRGDTVTGKAYLTGRRAKIALPDDWVMQSTSCGPA